MWIGHYAPGLIAKIFAPRVPLALLAFAGEANDALFFFLNFFGIESFGVNEKLAKRGCFPYDTHYPYSHSLVGIALTGVLLAFGYTLFARVRAQPVDQLAILACALSHFALEWPTHRADVQITPGDDAHIGEGLFDRPVVLFALELVVFFPALWAYARFAPPSVRAGTRNKTLMRTIIGVFLGQQVQFCFTAAPTHNTKWVHAPLFLAMILGSSWLLGKLEG